MGLPQGVSGGPYQMTVSKHSKSEGWHPSPLSPPPSSLFCNFFIIIYLPRILCLSFSCHIPVCRSCGTLSYSLCFSNQTDQEDEMEGLEREGLEGER